MPTLVYRTAAASLAMQLAIGAVTASALFLPPPEGESGITTVVAVEAVSQAIEFAWYAVAVARRKAILTWTRYIDWFFSTPVMIVSTMMFFFVRSGKEVGGVLSSPALYVSLALNWAMLACGLAVELGKSPLYGVVFVGSVFFVASFVSLATQVPEDRLSEGVFYAMFAVWALYGVAALFSDTAKNVSYNALDIVSKNFYGVFLFLYVSL